MWKQTHGKSYGTSADEHYRKSVFTTHYHWINDFNAKSKAQHGDSPDTHTVGLTQFADMTNDEFRANYTGYKGVKAEKNVKHLVGDAPDAIDWRDHNAVTDVKNQGSCGSCWAFSATGSMESRYFLANGELPNLSEQQLVDCSRDQGNMGCNGGLPDYAFVYAQQNGMKTQSDYPYKGVDGECQGSSQNY